MSRMRYSFACILIFLAFFQCEGQWDDSCTTPDGQVGSCQPIYGCKHILDFLSAARKPLSQKDRNTLFSYHCGYERDTVKVCCPGKPIVNQDRDGSTDNIGDNILRHRNTKLLPLENCGMTQTDDKILNGNITALFEFPWMALLRYNENGKDVGFRCGGTLINSRYVLTAAHCVTNLKEKTLTSVRLGEYDLRLEQDCETYIEGDTQCADPVQDFTFDEVKPHQEYNVKTFANDIALIRLNRNANISVDSVKPVCLPIAASVRNPDLTKATVTGWGRTTNEFQSNVLLKVEIPIMAPDRCKQRYNNIATITDNHICAGGVDSKDSCGGDSGGPLQKVVQYQTDVRYVQYGIVSFGPTPCSTRGLPGVYTRVNKYLDWILDNIKS